LSFVVSDVSSVRENVVAGEGVSAVEVNVRAAPQRQLFGRLHDAHIDQDRINVDPFHVRQNLAGFGAFGGIQLAVDPNFLALNAMLLDSFQQDALATDAPEASVTTPAILPVVET
jgi:hypothetical protein